MAAQLYIDESFSDGLFVFAGVLANPQPWADFNREWGELLKPFGTLAPDDSYHFKMSEMAANDERMKRMPAFYHVVMKSVAAYFSISLSEVDLKYAREKFWGLRRPAGKTMLDDPYQVCFLLFVQHLDQVFHRYKSYFADLGIDGPPVDLIFDQQSNQKNLLTAWKHQKASDIFKAFTRESPLFESDRERLPLQAADLWAWWVRHWMIGGQSDKMGAQEFDGFDRLPRDNMVFSLTFTRRSLLKAFRRSATIHAAPDGVRPKWWETPAAWDLARPGANAPD